MADRRRDRNHGTLDLAPISQTTQMPMLSVQDSRHSRRPVAVSLVGQKLNLVEIVN